MFADNKSLKYLKDKRFLENKAQFTHKMFNKMARDYDYMNNIISFGKNIAIKEQMIKNVPIQQNAKILDVCTGTGDLALIISRHIESVYITGVDFSETMLEVATNRTKEIKNIEFIQADALNMPFEDNTFDVSFISYGLRNLADIEKGLLEMKRVTKENGYVVNLDFGKSKSLYNRLFGFYFFNIVPLYRKLLQKDFTLYRYIPESNADFPAQGELVRLFYELGFREVKNYNFAFGTIAQQIAKV